MQEMCCLRDRALHLNGREVSRGAPADAIRCFSDASDSGYGAYVVSPSIISNHGRWAAPERQRSSTWRELTAVQRALADFRQQLSGCVLRWHCDNAAAVRILDFGSSKPHLQQIAYRIDQVCWCYNIRLFPVWIPRGQNRQADVLSKRSGAGDDWQLHPRWFHYLDSLWGPHTVDRFADNLNAHLPVFNSDRLCVGTAGVDAFSFSWTGQNNWLCPPVSLILRVLDKVKADKAVATLVVPWWESAYFWPSIRPSLDSWHSLIKEYIRLPAGYVRGPRSAPSSAFCEEPNFWTLALRLDAA